LTNFEHAFFFVCVFRSRNTHLWTYSSRRTHAHTQQHRQHAGKHTQALTSVTPVLQLPTNLITSKLHKNNIPPLVTDLEITKINRTLPLRVVTTVRILTSLWSSNFNRYDYYQRHLLRNAKITHYVSILCLPLLLHFYSYNYVVSIATLNL
jgi:hypothetical protein